MPVLIAPSILNANFADLRTELQRVRNADWLHLDIMDGHFVPNLSFGPQVVRVLRAETELPMEAHLMVDNPEQFIEPFAQAGVERIIVHPESTLHLHRLIERVKELGCEAGVALNPATPVSVLEYILSELSMVLVMTVDPGFGGQEFIPSLLPKVRKVRDMIREGGYRCEIGVDGGINLETARLATEAGATFLVVGTLVYHSADSGRTIQDLRSVTRREEKT